MKKYHYVYKLENKNPTDTQKYYIGCRSCDCEPKLDEYFSSSKIIKNIIKKNGNIFSKEIIKIFKNREDAILYEIELHKKYNVSTNDEFYNIVNQNNKKFDTTGLLFIDGQPIKMGDYKNSSLTYHSKNKVSVKDENGISFQTNVDNEKYKNGELKHVSYGIMPIKNNTKKSISVEEYYKNKEKYEPTNKNKVVVEDGDKRFLIDKNDERYINGDLKSIHVGKILSKDENGNIYYVNKKDFDKNNYVGFNKNSINGDKNPNAKTIHIFDSCDVLMYICVGDFKKVCTENDLPFISLKRSYMNDGVKIYNTKRGKTESIKKGNVMYIGWYAIEA